MLEMRVTEGEIETVVGTAHKGEADECRRVK